MENKKKNKLNKYLLKSTKMSTKKASKVRHTSKKAVRNVYKKQEIYIKKLRRGKNGNWSLLPGVLDIETEKKSKRKVLKSTVKKVAPKKGTKKSKSIKERLMDLDERVYRKANRWS
jgi:hypothetical protein